MSWHPFRQQDAPTADEIEVRALYRGWNTRSADAFATPFAEGGEVI